MRDPRRLTLRDLPLIDRDDEDELDKAIDTADVVGAAVGWILATVVMVPLEFFAGVVRHATQWPLGLLALLASKLFACYALVVVASRWRHFDRHDASDSK